MTSATAIVSPIARPRPSITAPTRPPLLCGSTAPLIISHRVAPSASAASFSLGGVVSITSRASDVMIGVIMIARMMPAVRKLGPSRVPKMRPTSGIAAEHVVEVLIEALHRLREHEYAPQPEHDRRNDREQVEHVDDRAAQPRGAICVTNSATPRLTGTASATAIAAV